MTNFDTIIMGSGQTGTPLLIDLARRGKKVAFIEKIIGACILGTGGDEIIISILNVMNADKPYTMIRDSIVSQHPTISELILTTLQRLTPVK